MKTKMENEANKLAEALRRRNPAGQHIRVARQLMSISRSVNRLAERQCERELASDELRLLERHCLVTIRIGAKYGFRPHLSKDPRGVGLKLRWLDGGWDSRDHNGAGGREDGYCVPF